MEGSGIAVTTQECVSAVIRFICLPKVFIVFAKPKSTHTNDEVDPKNATYTRLEITTSRTQTVKNKRGCKIKGIARWQFHSELNIMKLDSLKILGASVSIPNFHLAVD
jgi:hypothetical protein